jgi:hypothetical protein
MYEQVILPKMVNIHATGHTVQVAEDVGKTFCLGEKCLGRIVQKLTNAAPF